MGFYEIVNLNLLPKWPQYDITRGEAESKLLSPDFWDRWLSIEL